MGAAPTPRSGGPHPVAVAGIGAACFIPAVRDRFTVGDQAVRIGGLRLTRQAAPTVGATWSAIRDHPWIGHGPGQAQYFIQQRYVTIDHPHNEYLRMLYDLGWPAAFLWLTGLVMSAVAILRRARLAAEDKLRRSSSRPARPRGLHVGMSLTDLTISIMSALVGTLVGSMSLPVDLPRGKRCRDAETSLRRLRTGHRERVWWILLTAAAVPVTYL